MRILGLIITALLFCTISVGAQVIEITKTGWHSVSFSSLQAAGFDTNSNSNNWRLYNNGQQVPIKITSNAIEFFGQSAPTKYSKSTGYILQIESSTTAKRVGLANVRIKGNPTTFYPYTFQEDYNLFYAPMILNGQNEDNWFGYLNDPDGTSFQINLPQCSANSGTIHFDVSPFVTESNSYVGIYLNGALLGNVSDSTTFSVGNLQTGTNTIQLFKNPSVALSYYFVNSVEVMCDRETLQYNENVIFSLTRGKTVFDAGTRVFELDSNGDVTEYSEPYIDKKGNNEQSYLVSSGSITNDIVRPQSSYPLGTGNLIIVTADAFLSTAQQLSAVKQGSRTVKILTTSQIYDNYGSGVKSPLAITNALEFEKMQGAEYVIYLGDASYDPTNINVGGDYVPTYLYETSLGEAASDSMLSDFNGDGIEDLYSGRIPINDTSQGQTAINKIIRFEAQAARQPKSALFVADVLFETTVDSYVSNLPMGVPYTVIKKVNYTNAEMKQQIIDSFASNPYFVHYIGHGSISSWSQFFSRNDVNSLQNSELSFVFSGACNTGYFHDPNNLSLAEAMFFADNGAIVYTGESQVIWASIVVEAGMGMNIEMYDISNTTIGEAVKHMKSNITSDEFRRIYITMGDPTLELK